jgi:hypothetical protein
MCVIQRCASRLPSGFCKWLRGLDSYQESLGNESFSSHEPCSTLPAAPSQERMAAGAPATSLPMSVSEIRTSFISDTLTLAFRRWLK